MMLPTLISVSVAPVSYFFWASALPLMAAKAMTAVVNAAILVGDVESIISPWFWFCRFVVFQTKHAPRFEPGGIGWHEGIHQDKRPEPGSDSIGTEKALGFHLPLELADQALGYHRDLPGAVRYQEDDEEQQHAEHGAGKALGNAFGDVRHEDDEGGTDDRTRQPTDAADHHAEEQRDRERDGVAVRRHELHGNGAETAGNAGDSRADAERQRLVERDVDAHRGRRDLVVADRHEGAAGARPQQID